MSGISREMRTSALVDPLTPKQRRFVDARANGFSEEKAAKAAGLTYGYGFSTGKLPHVKAELARLQARNRERAQVTRDEVIKGFKEAIKDAKLTADPMAQISGWREIGKMCGYYEPERHELVLSDNTLQAIEQIRGLSTDRLLELAGPDIVDAEFTLVLDDDEEDDGG